MPRPTDAERAEHDRLEQFDLGPDELEWDEEDQIMGPAELAPPKPAPKKTPAKARKTPPKKADKDRPLQSPPFQIHRFDDLQRSYLWLDEWKGDGTSSAKKPPGPLQLRVTYGPGKYIVRDASAAEQRWRIGASPSDTAANEDLGAEPGGDAAELYHPPPAPIAPPAAWQAAYTPPPPSQYAGPPHPSLAPGAVAPTAQLDPALMGTIYRLDAAIQQISADQRRLQDELRSVTYELQQVPARVSERVAAAISDAVDPFDQMAKVYEMSRNMADGLGPGEEKGPGMAEMMAAALGALGGGGAPQPGAQPPPPPQLPAPAAAPAIPDADLELRGMTPQLRVELQTHAAARGITYQEAIELAVRQGWDAPTLVGAARATSQSEARTPTS